MQTTVTMGAASPPDWRARGEERIRQNVRNLLSLVRYELPYARTLGLPAGLIDLPAGEAATLYAAQAAALIRRGEPRARILSVQRVSAEESGQILLEVTMQVD